MKTVEAIVLIVVVLGLIGAACGVGGVLVARVVGKLLRRRAPWQMVEHSDGEQVRILAYRPDEDELLIGAVAFAAADFDSQLYELRAQGREKVYALNQQQERPRLLRRRTT